MLNTGNPLTVGVVGVGYWGEKHLRVLQSLAGVEAVAIDERLPQMPERAHLVAAGRGYTSLTAALPHVDAVVIATPPTSHVTLALEAIRAGKHVLVEKPLATTTADAQLLVDAAREVGVTLMSGHTFEYNAGVWMLRDLVQKGELGDLYYLNSARLNLGLYQRDVNVVLDLAPHDISIVNHVLGARPTSVQAWGSRHVHPDFEDVAYLRLDYDEIGVQANIHVSWLDPHKVRQVTAVGARKMAVFDDASAERIRIHDKGATLIPPFTGTAGSTAGVSYHNGDITSPVVRFAEPLAVQDKHFVECIREGLQPDTDGPCGLAVVQVLECAQIALAEGRRVFVEEVATSEVGGYSTADLVGVGAGDD